MGLVIGQAKYIIFPLKRINKLKCELPIHRKLKMIKNKSSNEEVSHKYLIDFRPTKNSDALEKYDTDDIDLEDYLDENDDEKNEDENEEDDDDDDDDDNAD